MIETTLHTKTAFKGKLLRLDLLEVRLPDGKRSNREIVYHPDAVCAVVFTKSGELVLVKQYRKAVNSILMEIPAGKVDPGETAENAIKRELEEEIGLQSGRLSRLTSFFTTPGFCTEKITLFKVEEAILGEPKLDEGEFLEPITVPIPKAIEMIYSGELIDGKSIAGILLALYQHPPCPNS